MRRFKWLFVVIAAVALSSCVAVDRDRDLDRMAACGGGHRLEVVDLNVSPDPLAEGQRIGRWFVRLRADATGECRTTIRVRDASGELIAQERVWRLRPGGNDIELTPLERYRFSRSEHCFQVTADIAGTPRPVDATRRFCARQIAGKRWSMR